MSQLKTEPLPESLSRDMQRRPGELRLIWVIWLTYGAFYFCRTNISAALDGMESSVEAGGLGLSHKQVGYILAALKISYGVGQFFNGQFSEYLSARKLLALGMLGSAALNVLFGFSTGFYFLLFVWALNGYCQSLGWTPCVRVMANWIPPLRRGRSIGFVGTGYQITASLTYVVAGQAAEHLGWRAAFYVPAAILAAAAMVMLLTLEERPRISASESDDAIPDSESNLDREPPLVALERVPIVESLILTLTNPTLWLLGMALGLLNACRYGFVDWGLTHLKEVQSSSVGDAALKYAVLPLGAVAGAYFTGWASDRLFGARRAPVVCILCLILCGLTLVYDSVARSSVIGTMFLLVAIGFTIFGPQVLLVGTAPADLARRGTAAAAAGFVNFLGYLGAASGDVATGYMLDNWDWRQTIQMWAGWALAAAVCSAVLWNVGARKE